MKFLDNDTMHWRVRLIDRLAKEWIWKLKYHLDFSSKEKVDKVSLVVVGRNDNYGGDFSDRLKATIDWNYNHLPDPELIYVEWNTIPDRPSDTEWIAARYPNSKCFIVPNEIHRVITTNPKLPMMEYFAKNIGIREASNEWILLVNADVFLGYDALHNLRHLSKKYVYGTHYKNIIWDKKPISDRHLNDKSIVKNSFSTNWELHSVVGNFVMTHRDNWYVSGGYDEALTDVRSGVDNNGLMQLLYNGVKPMVIGKHYHLDHNESLIKGANDTHGNTEKISGYNNVPYKNAEDWGLRSFPRVQIAPHIWKLKMPGT